MTPTVTRVTIDSLRGVPYGALSTGAGLVAIAVLMVLLVAREPLRFRSRGSRDKGGRSFNMATVPLVIVFALMVGLRIAQLLRLATRS